MALPISRVTLRATNGDNNIVNTLHYRMTPAAGDVADYQGLANWFRDHVMDLWRACIIPSWTVQPVVVLRERDPHDPTEVRDEYTSGAPAAGTRLAPPSGEVIPIQMCGLARLSTGFAGRSSRGRLFLPPIWSDASIDGGVISGSQLGNYQAFAAGIPLSPGSPALARLVVFSRTRAALTGVTYDLPVTNVAVDTAVHWLRRRAA